MLPKPSIERECFSTIVNRGPSAARETLASGHSAGAGHQAQHSRPRAASRPLNRLRPRSGRSACASCPQTTDRKMAANLRGTGLQACFPNPLPLRTHRAVAACRPCNHRHPAPSRCLLRPRRDRQPPPAPFPPRGCHAGCLANRCARHCATAASPAQCRARSAYNSGHAKCVARPKPPRHPKGVPAAPATKRRDFT